MRSILILMTLSLVACGGQSTDDGDDTELATTSGGESTVEHPLRTTTPVPVPQPAVAREELSEALQTLWTHIEETVAIRPPDGPEEATVEHVNAWSRGPFTAWIGERREHMREAIASSEGVPDDPAHERAVAAALLAYSLEDFVADVRGAPIPDEVATDPELLAIYVGALAEQIDPLATEAVIHYAYCQRRLAALGDESEWLPWRAYCVQHGQEMIDVYGLAPPGEASPSDADTEAGSGMDSDADAEPDSEADAEPEPSS